MHLRRLRSALLFILMGWVLAAGVFASQAATAAAWQKVFAHSLCTSTSDHDASASHHAACAAHCAAASMGQGGLAGVPPAAWRVSITATHEAAASGPMCALRVTTSQTLPPVRAPPLFSV